MYTFGFPGCKVHMPEKITAGQFKKRKRFIFLWLLNRRFKTLNIKINSLISYTIQIIIIMKKSKVAFQHIIKPCVTHGNKM